MMGTARHHVAAGHLTGHGRTRRRTVRRIWLKWWYVNVTDSVKRLLVGRKLASSQLSQTLLPKRLALPVFASDALSSVAYATDEILLTLSLAGTAILSMSWEVALAVSFVILVVVLSYRQTVHAYPSGGGDYEVATANLGPNFALIVASALMVDYTLTVAVSISSGVQNAEAMLPESWRAAMSGHEGIVAAIVIVFIMSMNLRGVRESGRVFAVPVYAFIVGILAMVIWGLVRIFVLGQHLQAPTANYGIQGIPSYEPIVGFGLIFLLARTFSSGCAALTGVEAISNGVPAFRKPKSRNAATTLAMVGGLSVSMLTGVIVMAHLTGVKLADQAEGSQFTLNGHVVNLNAATGVGQLASTVFNDFPFGFYLVVTATALILFLAANTAFNGFPVLGSILARDSYLPKVLHQRGDRLAYSNGILVLATVAVVLVLVFNASVTALIQLYVLGVFVSFTTSQCGMIIHWTRRLKTETDSHARFAMQRSRVINTVGMICSGTVLIIVLISKFTHGAYIAVIAMSLLYMLMRWTHTHYAKVEREVAVNPTDARLLPSRVRAVVVVFGVNKPTMRAVNFARATRASTIEAVTVAVDEDETNKIADEWSAEGVDVPLKVIASPYRDVVGPLINYIGGLRSDNPRDVVCVYLPEYVVGHWWEGVLHNQTGLFLKTRLNYMTGVMVTAVPYLLASSTDAIKRANRRSAAWRRSGTGQVRMGLPRGRP